MEDIVRFIVSNLLDNPDTLEINSNLDGDVTIINVLVPENEIGRVIGKNGRIAQSIRTIIRSAANKSSKKYAIKISAKPEVSE